MRRRAAFMLVLVALAFTAGAAAHAATSLEMAVAATESTLGDMPCDGCGDGDDTMGKVCPSVCVATALPAMLPESLTWYAAVADRHERSLRSLAAGLSAPPEPYPPRRA